MWRQVRTRIGAQGCPFAAGAGHRPRAADPRTLAAAGRRRRVPGRAHDGPRHDPRDPRAAAPARADREREAAIPGGIARIVALPPARLGPTMAVRARRRVRPMAGAIATEAGA